MYVLRSVALKITICDNIYNIALGSDLARIIKLKFTQYQEWRVENMKRKIVFLNGHRDGTSYEVISKAISNKGTTIICNGCTGIESYKETFPALRSFTVKDGQRPFSVEKNSKYFIAGSIDNPKDLSYNPEFLTSLIFGCDYGCIGNDKKALVIFDDGSWNGIRNKMKTFWKLTHSKCQIIIVVQYLEDILDIALDKDMRKDILKYWNICI